MASKWCMLRDDYRVKTLVKKRMSDGKIMIRTLANNTGIAEYRISRYLNHNHLDGLPSLTQHQLITICEYLGIEVTLNIRLKDD